MPFDEHPTGIDKFNWGSDEFIGYIDNLPEFHGNQYFKGLRMLLKQSPNFVYHTDLWQEALSGVNVTHLDDAKNKFFQNLRKHLETSGLDKTVQPYQLRDFHCSVAMRPLNNGASFLPKERDDLIKTMRDPKARKIARVVYPVMVSDQILRSHFDAKNFAIVNFLLQNPNQPMTYQFLIENGLAKSNTNIGNLKDAIDHRFRDLGLPTRLFRQDDMLGINLEG